MVGEYPKYIPSESTRNESLFKLFLGINMMIHNNKSWLLTKTVEQSRVEVVMSCQFANIVSTSHFDEQNLKDAGGKLHPL
jgi:hypothetical protein